MPCNAFLRQAQRLTLAIVQTWAVTPAFEAGVTLGGWWMRARVTFETSEIRLAEA